MYNLDMIGSGWAIEEVKGLTEEVHHVTPSSYNEARRYLPPSVTSIPGYIRYAVNPFMREIVDCFDVESPVREVNLKKGVQITYSTVLESGAFYFMGHVKVLPMMYITADKELAKERIENNFIPMLNHSGMSHIVRSSDEGNNRKTGMTASHIQFEGGGYLVPFGANNAAKMRAYSICLLMKDEIDGWPDTVGPKKEDPDKTTDARCKGFWDRRKIFRGSTPLIKGSSKIQRAYLKGDQRKYMVVCMNKECQHLQFLRWEVKNPEKEITGGFRWGLDDDGMLVLDSVRYICPECGHAHYEHDKEVLFSEEAGAHWKPTAKPTQPGIRSYHLPAFYSPIGMAPWYSLVADYIACVDQKTKRVTDIAEYQAFYNNVLAEPFAIMGAKVRFESVSAHRRACYRLGEIPNAYAEKHSGSKILFLTCQVDVHKSNLAVTVMGWCKDSKPYVIDYWRFEVTGKDGDDDCQEITCSVWGRMRELLEETIYTADDGTTYNITVTLVDAGYANDTVVKFCAEYSEGVYPILGRDRPAKNQTIKEFAEFTTQGGTVGYRILVDHYKDRMAPVLRREWIEEMGPQKAYHFNAPVDITDKQLKELTVEIRRKVVDAKNNESYEWYRPGNARNELWDLLGYGYAGVEILAWNICIKHFELDTVDWARFWEYVEAEGMFRTEKSIN